MLLDGDEGPDGQPDGPLPVNVEIFDRLSEASVRSVQILKSTLKSWDFWKIANVSSLTFLLGKAFNILHLPLKRSLIAFAFSL